MKKKLFGAVLAGMLLVSQAFCVCAEGSKTADVELPSDQAQSYTVAAGNEESFAATMEVAPKIVETVLQMNEGTISLNNLTETLLEMIASEDTAELDMTEEQVQELAAELEGKDMVTPFFDLEPINGGIQDEDGKYIFTLSVPSLTEAMTNVKLLHYSTARKLWEVVAPEDVDYGSKQITAKFEDFSPVAVIAEVDETAADNAEGTSPQTGVTSGWTMWIVAAAVLAAVGATSFRKAKQ